jgi:hypothetical protein
VTDDESIGGNLGVHVEHVEGTVAVRVAGRKVSHGLGDVG